MGGPLDTFLETNCAKMSDGGFLASLYQQWDQ